MGYNPDTGIYTIDSPTLVNAREFTRTAQFFQKHEVYTKAHPVYDKLEYDAFWDEEERRRRFGYTVGGITITGEHYGFLNFGPINRTKNPNDVKGIIKDPKHARRIGTKNFDFPDLWDGHYKWYHAKEVARKLGLHVLGGKARRKGFSYIGGFDAFNSYDLHPKQTTIIGAFDNKYLIRGDGTFAMAKKFADFININTDWKKNRLVSTKDTLKSGYKLRGEAEERGFLSQILALSFKDNPDAAVGKDARKIILEEWGVFPNIENVLGVTISILEDGDTTTGQLIGWGTGGTKDANWETFERIFYHPKSHKFLAVDNIWDEGARGTTCGFFFPHIQNLIPYIDENGNSKLDEAKAASDRARAEKKANTTSASDYNLFVGQRANSPAEAFSRSVANIFTSKELTDHIRYVKNNEVIKNLPRIGIITKTKEGKARLTTNAELESLRLPFNPPLLHHPFEAGENVSGCVVEWQPPYRDPTTGKIPDGLYRLHHDPYAADKDKKDITLKHSLGATYVYERPNIYTPTRGDIYVAAYVGRPQTMDEYNEQMFRLAEYYNAIIMFENVRGDVKPFAQRTKRLHLLANEPEMNWKKELASNNKNPVKGMGMNHDRKSNGAIYLKDWIYTVRGVDSDGNTKMNLHYINDLGVLQELEKWNLSGNFDRISSLIIGQFDRLEQTDKEIQLATPHDPNSFFNRSFF